MKGRFTHRFKDNPMEKRFADAWEDHNANGHTTEYLLSSIINERAYVEEVDQEKIATIIQWLGSPVGLAFLEDALGIDDLRKQIHKKLEH